MAAARCSSRGRPRPWPRRRTRTPAPSWHRCSACSSQTGAAVLRLARWSLFLGTAAVVLGLGKVHAQYLGLYDFTRSFRFGWALAYIMLLAVAAYGAGLPDLPRTPYQALSSSVAA